MERLGIHICSTVDKQRSSLLRRDQRRKRRSLYTFKSSDYELSSHKYRSRRTGRNEGITLAFLYQSEPLYYGGILLVPDSHNRRLGSLYDFCGINCLNALLVIGILRKLSLYYFFTAADKELDIISTLKSLYCTFNDLNRCIVSAHCIKGDFYRFCHETNSTH